MITDEIFLKFEQKTYIVGARKNGHDKVFETK